VRPDAVSAREKKAGKFMKAVVILALASFSSLALAEQASAGTQPQSPAVEQYTYGMKLDVAHVVSTTDVSNQCGIVPAQMTYEDSQGQRHTVEYQVWGNGCSGG
jgi:hypothetical protein